MDTPRVSDIVVEKIERSILEGTLKPGQRLPAERKFAEQMGVSRPSSREALQKLSARGMLVARRGGGTTVTKSLNPALENPLLELISNSPDCLPITQPAGEPSRISNRFEPVTND